MRSFHLLLLLAVASTLPAHAAAPFVPGTGTWLANCSDDFEDANWSYRTNLPKSSYEQDENQRAPGGYSNNGLWHEGAKRGTPDSVKRIATPAGGIEGSTGALYMATRYTGIPGRLSNEQQQDDLLMKFDRRLGRSIPVSWQPSCTVRVYLPPFEQWENRSGSSFGVRCDCRGKTLDGEYEPYWPGMFIVFQSETSKRNEVDSAYVTVRSNTRGGDMKGPTITEPGWWTFGMSFTGDGQIHYYASPGTDDLTAEDHLASSFAYSYRCESLNNFFFNVANWDNGQSWSTPWVIDDPKVFVNPPQGANVAQLYRNAKYRPNTGVATKPRTNASASRPTRQR